MLNINRHREIMLRVLKDIYARPSLAPFLGFKGGTAVYLLYDLPRFSVDLDFDLLNTEKEDLVFDELANLLKKYGQIEQATKKHFTLFYLLSYQKGWQKLKVEVSRRSLGSNFETTPYLGMPFLVMVKADMFANKLVALTQRRKLANRDLFDLHFFLKESWPVNIGMVEKQMNQFYPVYMKKCLKVIEKVPAGSLLTNMGELVDEKTKFWIKNSLQGELLTLFKIHLDSLEK